MDGDSFQENTERVQLDSHFDDQTNRRNRAYDTDSIYSNPRDVVTDMNMHRCKDKPLWGEFEGKLPLYAPLLVEEPAFTPQEPGYGQYP